MMDFALLVERASLTSNLKSRRRIEVNLTEKPIARMLLTTSVSGRTAGQLQGLADKHNSTVSRVMREIIEAYLQ